MALRGLQLKVHCYKYYNFSWWFGSFCNSLCWKVIFAVHDVTIIETRYGSRAFTMLENKIVSLSVYYLQWEFIPVGSKKCMSLGGCGKKRMRPIFETKLLIYQSKANLDVKILFGNITHLIDLEIWEILEKGLFGDQDSTFHSGPWFTCYSLCSRPDHLKSKWSV